MGNFKFIDLFAGIGGFHIACANQGGECVFASEWDRYCRDTYSANFNKNKSKLFDEEGKPTDYFAGDITKVNIDFIPDFDLLCAGFPCQPFSVAGKRKGFDDTRGTLFFNVAKIVEKKKPKVIFLENVRGLKNHNNGHTFNRIKEVINSLGYDFYDKIIKASDFNCPQHRPRLFMVGVRRDLNKLFKFPSVVPLTTTMSDVFDGKKVNRNIGFTLRVGGRGSGINDRRNWDCYLVDDKETRITSKEAKRMQGFPDDFIMPVSESQAMKQLGNSVAIPAVEETIKEIIRVL